MRAIKIGAGVLNQIPLDWDGNRDRILEAIEGARREQVAVLALPELCITGYGCEDAFQSPGLMKVAWEVLEEILPATEGMVVALGLPVFFRHALYNCAALAVDGRLVGLPAKKHLAGDGLHYEPRWFRAWPHGVVNRVKRGDRKIPIGDLYFEIGDVRLGFEICEDAWVASRPGGELAFKGMDVLLNPSSSHFAFGKQKIRERFVLEGSRAFGVTYVYTNPVGNEAGRSIYDGGALVASGGEMVARGPRFRFAPVQLTTAVADLDLTEMRQSRLVSYEPELGEEDPGLVEVEFQIPEAEPESPEPELPPWERSDHHQEEEFTRAVCLGLYDYLRKSGSRGFVVSLSGGADSSGVACLVHTMAHLGWEQRGREAFLEPLRYIEELDEVADPRDLVSRLLTCVYQETRNSSDDTRKAAALLAEELGCTYYELDVDHL
ncbi:MAG: nitrilase-related carbon-nitrogen hydrolase, partial [Thermoanaerobaculia bacterium]|nr:nitrilase-related carbon-nitrogen hydrolase [Thermoanaerobaculia bacterium]